ncbi:MAG: HEAT repeat domain-containing protein [Candidatus Hodarchaeota archaeon]
MSEDTLLEDLKNKKVEVREKAAKKLGKYRTKTALHALLETAQNDNNQNVRKAAIKSIRDLDDPEAIPTLKKISKKDEEKDIRDEADRALKEIQFSEADRLRAERDARALEKGEATQGGLYCKIKENASYWMDREGNLTNEKGNPVKKLTGTGLISITNTGDEDRIWAIKAKLKNAEKVDFVKEFENVSVEDSTVSINELEASDTAHIGFKFQLDKPKVYLEEDFVDAENEEIIPTFSRGMETGMQLKLKITNDYDYKITDVQIKKYLNEEESGIDSFETNFGEIEESSDENGRHILWTIPEVDSKSEVTASCVIWVTLPEDASEPYSIGNTVLTYKTADYTISGLDLHTLSGSSSVFQYIRREEEEETPDTFICQFELENTSEFEMDLSYIRIFEGSVEDDKILVEWVGDKVSEEERSIDPGEVFTLKPWKIKAKEDQIPQFGREIDLSVKYLYDAEVETQCTIPGYVLPFINIEATKKYAVETIQSYSKTPVETLATITSNGTTEIQLLELEDYIPEGFEAPKKENIIISKNSTTLPPENMEVELIPPPEKFKGQVLRITIPHLEETELGPLKQDEKIIVKYPIKAISPKPEEEFSGKLIAKGNIYPEISPVKAIAEPEPITVIHTRRKIKIGKMVRSTTTTGDIKEYEVILRGENNGTAILENVVISDFIPKGFTLVDEPVEEPPVGHEEQTSVKEGITLKWVYKTIEPDEEIEIRYKLRAEGDYDPKEVYRMLLG